MTLPCGIAFRANNSILVESVFHGAKDAKEEDQKSLLCDLCGLGAKNFLVPGAGIEPARTFRSPGF